MMGARQWAGQADTHIALTTLEYVSEEPGTDGLRHLRGEIRLQTAKVRTGEPNPNRRLVIESTKDAEGRLLTLSVTDGGRYESEPVTTQKDDLADELTALLLDRGEPMRRSDIAAALGGSGGSLNRALKQAIDDGTVIRSGHGVYALPAPEPKF